MPRRIVISALVVFVAGALLFLIPFLTAKREVTALTPAVVPLPPGGLVPATLGPGSELCIRDLPMSPDGQEARIITATGAQPGPALAVRAIGPGYVARTRVPAGWTEGPLEVPLKPPPTSLRGSLCFRNAGKADFSVMASGVGQKLARPQPYLGKQALQQDVPLTFHRAKQASLLSRTGAVIDHASVFTPLPKPLIWLLLIAVLVAFPLLPLLAMRSAVAVDGDLVPAETAPGAPPFPGARRLRRIRTSPWVARVGAAIRRIPVGAVLALIGIAGAVYVYIWGIRVTTYTPDETLYVAIANWLPHHLPGGLFQLDFYERGPQRLEIFVLSLGLHLFGSPAGFKFTHLVNALAFGSTTIPTYLMARGLAVRRPLALVGAALVVAVPWTVLMTSVLTETLAYPCFAWAVWATWRAVVEPSARRELLSLALIALAILARSIFLALLALLPAAVFLQEWRFGSL